MNIINDFLHNSVKKYPEKIAIVDSGKKYTFSQLDELVSNFSSNLIKYPKSSVISIIFENSVEFVISYLGTLRASCIAHLVAPYISEINLIEQIKSAEPKMIVYSKSLTAKIEKIPSYLERMEFEELPKGKTDEFRKINSEDIAYLIYTSGTTSKPKGIGVTHSNAVFTTKNIVNVLEYNEFDVDVLPLPLSHSFGLGCLHTSLLIGSTLVLHRNTMNVSEIFRTMQMYNATTFAAVPATLTKLLREHHRETEENFSSLRLIMTNSTQIPSETVKGFKKILKKGKIATYYGLTEASRSTFMIFDNDEREDSVGIPAPGVQIKIANESNSDNQGEIWIKGENVIKNYWNNSEADKNIVEGWLKTGDLGYFDNGYLYLTGRLDDVINIAGEKVVPEEIERVVKMSSGIEEAVAIGIRHEIYGEVVKLFVHKSKNSKIDKAQIMSHCIKNLERYKVPTTIEFVEEFPRTDSGKIKRFMLH